MEKKENAAIVQQLIEQFDFSELSEEQRELVLQHSSADEYNELRDALKRTQDYFENQPSLRASKLLKPVVNSGGMLRRIINYKIPLYKAAAIVVIVLTADAFIDSTIQDSFNIERKDSLVDSVYNDTISILIDSGFSAEIDQMKWYTSQNSINYNTGLERLYSLFHQSRLHTHPPKSDVL